MGLHGRPPTHTRRIGVWLSPALLDRLRLLAWAQGISVNAAARAALAEYVDNPVSSTRRRTR
jgi:predicted HicB family RNase H-like nuclease